MHVHHWWGSDDRQRSRMMKSSPCYIIMSISSTLGRRLWDAILITAAARTRTMHFCTIYVGDVWLASTLPSPTPLWSMVGHTQFGPDWLAGLLKSHYRKADAIQCLDDVADIVQQSTPRSGILQPKVVGEEDTPVPTYSWTDHLQQLLKPLPGLRQYHHFWWVVSSTATVWYTVVPNHHINYLNTVLTVVFWLLQIESAEPGVVFAKMSSVAEEECFCLLRESVATMPTPADLPGKKAALGLSQERQAYLYKEIRSFVDEAKADLIAPKLPNAHHESKRRR